MSKSTTTEQPQPDIIGRLKRISEESADFNDRGAGVIRWGYGTAAALGADDRYKFDFEYCRPVDGWKQYDTDQDAHYFGVWVHIEQRLILTYAEGDLSVVFCHNDEQLRAELDHMADFYGDPPPAFVAFDLENNTETHVYDERPKI